MKSNDFSDLKSLFEFDDALLMNDSSVLDSGSSSTIASFTEVVSPSCSLSLLRTAFVFETSKRIPAKQEKRIISHHNTVLVEFIPCTKQRSQCKKIKYFNAIFIHKKLPE